MSYPVYAELRDSGVEWLGTTPASWYKERLKFSVQLVNDKVEVLPDGLPYIGLENVQSQTGRILLTDGPQNIEGNCSLFQQDDVLFGKLRPYLAKVAKVSIDGACSTEILVLRPIKLDSAFLAYYLLSGNIIQVVDASTYGAKMPRASWDFIGNLPQLIPPRPEQRHIAAFLDAKTAEIDELIALKERQVGLLQQKRMALISRVVTKGLDPHAPMRDSGVGWLGEVPAEWKIKRLKFVAIIQSGLTLGKDYRGQQTIVRPYLRVANVQDGFLDLENITQIALPASEVGRYELHAGDVLMTEGGDFDKLGRGYVWEGQIEDCLHQNHIFAVRPNQREILPHFLSYLMTSLHGKNYFTSTAQQTTNLATTNSTKLGDFPLVLPPLTVQQEIIGYLEHEIAHTDSLVAIIEEQVEKLRIYRQALITAAVTGKIDVRGARIQAHMEG